MDEKVRLWLKTCDCGLLKCVRLGQPLSAITAMTTKITTAKNTLFVFPIGISYHKDQTAKVIKKGWGQAWDYGIWRRTE